MRRIPSGTTDQYLYFVAVDSVDYVTRETGLSSFTVRRSRNGGASAAYTTPTINETDSSNMPGVYELLLDEDMTIDSGDQSQEVVLHITCTGMAPVTLVYELYRPDVTAGETLTVASGVGNANVTLIEGSDATNQIRDSIVDDATRIDASALNTLSSHDPGETIMGATDLGTGAGLTSLASAADLATVDTVVDAIQAKTDNLPTDPADASVIAGRFDTLDTSIADLPTNAELATALGTADDAVLTAIGALETHGDATWATATGFSTHSAADVWSVGTRVLTASTNLGDLDDAILAILGTPAVTIADDIAGISAGSGPTASEIADEVQTRTIAAVTTVGSVTGEVDANIVKVNSVTVNGTGTGVDPWGP